MAAVASRKARGAFYTPPKIAAYLTEWAIRSPDDTVVEPSCGEAVFLEAAWERIRARGGACTPSGSAIFGYEIDEAASRTARSVVSRIGAPATIETGDFFDATPTASADAVVGNPPYVRYQTFAGPAREKAQRAALDAGVRLDGLASSWAPFVVHASRFLKDDGRLALVLPAELLHARYAAPVRRYLMRRFGQVTLVTFGKLVFPGVTSEVLLLLAEGPGPTDSIELLQVEDLDGLRGHRVTSQRWRPPQIDAKWSAALIAGESLDLYRELTDCGDFVPLSGWGEVSLGAVSGNNSYFRIPPSSAAAYGLRSCDLVDVLPPNGKALRGLAYSRQAHRELADRDERTLLFHPQDETPSASAQRYIARGKARDVHRAYKCGVRDPWWRVPLPGAVADLFVTYMNHDSPRLIANGARVHALNSVHGVTVRRQKRLARKLLPIAALNSVTALGAEIIGRSYGGGVLKVEPREAARLPVPSPELIRTHQRDLETLVSSVGRLLRSGKYDDIRSQVDSVLFQSQGSGERFSALRGARDILRSRRHDRSR